LAIAAFTDAGRATKARTSFSPEASWISRSASRLFGSAVTTDSTPFSGS
jgi:hypothetical protein